MTAFERADTQIVRIGIKLIGRWPTADARYQLIFMLTNISSSISRDFRLTQGRIQPKVYSGTSMSLLGKTKRRKVFQVAAAYAVVATLSVVTAAASSR